MAYSTETIVREQSPFKSSTLITSAYVVRKIAQADSIIDGVIGEVYDLPLTETPAIIQSLSEGIATCLLFQEQNKNIEVEPGVSIIENWNFLMDQLEMIRTRKIKLFGTTGAELSLSDRIKPQFVPNDTTSATDSTEQTAPKIEINKKF